MDLEKLESFIMLARVKNFTEAADNLYISQPALSKRIRSLEAELRVPLFNRIGKKTFLTSEGEYFYKYAKNTVASYNLLLEHISQLRNLEKGTLKFGATNFIGVYLMPQIILEFTKKYPNIDIQMTINSSKNIISLLENNELEFIFISDYILDENNQFVSRKLTSDRLKLIVSKDNPLANKTLCSIEEIEGQKYITKGGKSSQTKFLSKIFDKAGYELSNKLIINNQEAIKEAVCQNIGFGIMSEKAVEKELRDGSIKTLEIEGFDLSRDIEYVYIKDLFLTPAAKEFIRIANEIYKGEDLEIV
ncbi:LysR substrate-binding domain-containing protein [Peptoniphilaceae bacterium SGI.131]